MPPRTTAAGWERDRPADRPKIEQQASGKEPHCREEKRRHLGDADPDRQKGGAPDEVNDGEGEQGHGRPPPLACRCPTTHIFSRLSSPDRSLREPATTSLSVPTSISSSRP